MATILKENPSWMETIPAGKGSFGVSGKIGFLGVVSRANCRGHGN